jgi:hypothetical protein
MALRPAEPRRGSRRTTPRSPHGNLTELGHWPVLVAAAWLQDDFNNPAVRLAETGRRAEGLAAAQEATRLY